MGTTQGLEEPGNGLGGDGTMQVLTFVLAGQEYAVDATQVEAIAGWKEPLPVPGTPASVRGVIDLHGTIVPIVDLRDRLQLEPRSYGPTTTTIVLGLHRKDAHRRVIGIVVDDVHDVVELPPGSLRQTPDLGRAVDIDFIAGIAPVGETMLLVIDPVTMLGPDNLNATGRDVRRCSEPVPA